MQVSTFENIAMSIIWLYSDITIHCYDYATEIYNSNSIIQLFTDLIFSAGSFLSNQYTVLTSQKRNEPTSTHWFCVCTLPDVDRYFEMYEMIRDVDENNNKEGTSEQRHSFAFSFSDFSDLDIITILKNNNTYTVQFFDPIRNSVDLVNNNTVSSFEVMSISYSHPKMKTSIDLNIPKSMFIVGNQLFSPVFVKRCLEYQEEDFYFDLHYTITIIDKNIQIYTIQSSEYLLVEPSTVSIHPIQTKPKIT